MDKNSVTVPLEDLPAFNGKMGKSPNYRTEFESTTTTNGPTILSTKPLIKMMKLERPPYNQALRLRTTWSSVGLAYGWSTESWVTKRISMIYLRG